MSPTKDLIQARLRLIPVFCLETDKILQEEIESFLEYFQLNTAWKTFDKKTNNIILSNGRLGFELEMEHILPLKEERPPLWSNIEDGSLRERGTEFLSLPLPAKHVKLALFILQQYLNRIAKRSPNFSWRTSSHIHANVQTLTIARFLFLIRLYLVFEFIIYAIVSPDRQTSNFCVPLYESHLDKVLGNAFSQGNKASLRALHNIWPKYAGLSIFRLFDLGTVEFRHLQGTQDIPLLITWSNIILSLYNAAERLEIDNTDVLIKTLNTTSEYEKFFHTILGNSLPFKKEYSNLLEQGVIFTRHCLFPFEKERNFPVPKTKLKTPQENI